MIKSLKEMVSGPTYASLWSSDLSSMWGLIGRDPWGQATDEIRRAVSAGSVDPAWDLLVQSLEEGAAR